MKDCEKMIMVFYICVGHIEESHRGEFFENVVQSILAREDNGDGTIMSYFVPCFNKDGNSRIEVLNPRYIPEDEYKKIVEDFNAKYKEIIETKNTKNGEHA